MHATPHRRGRFPVAAAALVIVVLATGCARRAPSARFTDPPPPTGPRAVFLGSSTVFGKGASRPARRWTSQLSRYAGLTEVNLGLPGSRLADDLRTRIPAGEASWRQRVVAARPDLLVVMYGANDVYNQVPLGATGEAGTFRNAAASVLRGARHALPETPMVVIDPQPIAAVVETRAPYDEALAAEAAQARALFVHAGGAFPPDRLDELAADDIHLNDRGHALLASFITRQLELAGMFPAAALAQGGSGLDAAPPAPRGFHVDPAPLSSGVLRAVAVHLRDPGVAAVAVVRLDGGGPWIAYRTPLVAVGAGLATYAVEHWRVLDGDHLAVLLAPTTALGSPARWPRLGQEALARTEPMAITANPEWTLP